MVDRSNRKKNRSREIIRTKRVNEMSLDIANKGIFENSKWVIIKKIIAEL